MAKPRRIEDVDKNLKAKNVNDKAALTWRSAADQRFQIRGLAWWEENEGAYCRLPRRAEGCVRDPVWFLAQQPASAYVTFRSDATDIAARVRNAVPAAMQHMPPTGSSGLYLHAGEPGQIRPWCAAIPEHGKVDYERLLIGGLEKKMREYRLYLPLYNALQSLEIGLSKRARVLPPSPPRLAKPVVFYGTSITQGGCASTAGSDFVSTIGRMMNLDVINLGFSGNGQGEPEVAELIREIDASLYVLDYAANVNPQKMKKTLPVFVERIRAVRPDTPILIVTSICFSSYNHSREIRTMLEDKRDVMLGYYVKQRKRDRNVHIADGFGLIPFGCDNAYVDGVHPTDRGFQLMAERLVPYIDQILFHD